MVDLKLIFVPPKYTTDGIVTNDTPTGLLAYVPFFEPWFRLVTGESLNKLVIAINELLLRLNLGSSQRVITAAGDFDVELGEFQILVDKTVPQATTLRLPSVAEFVTAGYNFAPIIIKDLAQNSGSYNITVLPDGSDTIDGMPQWTLAGDGASISLRALNDKSGWYIG